MVTIKKALLILILTISLSSCKTSKNTDIVPYWFLNVEAESGKLIGYGEANSYEGAIMEARNSIASQIQIHLTSTTELSSLSKDKDSSSTFKQNITAIVDTQLTGVEKLEEELINGIYYCALLYDTRPLRQQVLDFTIPSNATAVSSENIKAYLPFSTFLKNNQKPLNFQLESLNNMWYVFWGGQKIKVSRSEFSSNFFPLVNNDVITLKKGLKNGLSVKTSDPNELKIGQLFSIEYKPQLKNGYLNLFYIDNDGVTLSLLEDFPINESFIEYPEMELYDGLIADKNSDYKNSVDLILAVESSKPIGFVSLIDKVSSSNINHNESLFYGFLLEEISDYKFSSIIVKIKE